ncbi:MAG: glycosyltransferase [Armatimonadetes bacterium]|nr:glycosyltransferase [Armatimonadota bacterium]
MKLAIVHDFLNQMGGAEQVVKVFREIFPDAPIYTSIYVPSAVCPSFKEADVRTSFMQRLPMIRKHARRYLPLYPYAFEQFNLSEYDVVLSSSSSFAKGVVTPPSACHICYCYTPMRFAWTYHMYVEQEPLSRLARLCLPYFIHRVRRWDEITSNRVDNFIAISHEIRRRIWKHYRRESDVIHPPVDTTRFAVSDQDSGYYLILSRLLPYKKIDVAVEAFNVLQMPLKIVGDGRDMTRLKRMAGPTIEFLGRLPDSEMQRCLRECRALVFPGFEDFGLTPVEAMACGKPVIAYAAGGALETVVDGITGRFFDEQTPEAIARVVRSFDPTAFDPSELRSHAESFDVSVFKKQIKWYVDQKYDEHISGAAMSAAPRTGILASLDSQAFQPRREHSQSTTDGR